MNQWPPLLFKRLIFDRLDVFSKLSIRATCKAFWIELESPLFKRNSNAIYEMLMYYAHEGNLSMLLYLYKLVPIKWKSHFDSIVLCLSALKFTKTLSQLLQVVRSPLYVHMHSRVLEHLVETDDLECFKQVLYRNSEYRCSFGLIFNCSQYNKLTYLKLALEHCIPDRDTIVFVDDCFKNNEKAHLMFRKILKTNYLKRNLPKVYINSHPTINVRIIIK